MAKKTKNTTARTLNPYISLFDLGGELSATPSYLSDIPEVSDTAIDPNLKLDTGKGFDIKSLLGMDLEGSDITTGLNRLTNVTDDRGIQNTKKSAINSGIGAGVEWGTKAFKATGNPLVAAGVGIGAGFISAGINNKKTKVANKEVADDLGNYYAGLPNITSANPYKMVDGGFKTSEKKAINDAWEENIKDLKYGKYIEDPIKRKQQVKNVFWSMLDNGFDPFSVEDNMRKMSGYGSQRGGLASENEWGWDNKDINRTELVNYYNEYYNIKPNNVQQERGSQSENIKQEMQKPILNKFEMGGDKSVNNFNGESHENGGIKLTEGAEVEGGETSYKDYVFSDTLKVPGKKITFAQATKRIEAKYKGRENDQYSERAKEQALTEYMQQNEMVKAIEEKKQAHAQELQGIMQKFKLGGNKKDKKSPGVFPDMENDNSFVDYNVGEGSLPDMYKRSYLNNQSQLNSDFNFPQPVNNLQSEVIPTFDYEAWKTTQDKYKTNIEDNSTTTNNTKNKSKIGNEEMALGLSMLPGLYNVAKGWKPDVTNFQNMNPNLVNLESERENLRREAGKARLIANENVRNIGGGSGTALAALAAQSSAINDSKMKGLSDSYQREHLANVTTLNDFLVRNNSINNEEIVANEQNKAMSDSLKSLGLSDLSNNAQGYLRDKELNRANDKSNKMKLDAMNSLFPNYKWGIDPENDKMVLEYVQSFGGTGGLGAYTGTSNKATKSNAKSTTTNN